MKDWMEEGGLWVEGRILLDLEVGLWGVDWIVVIDRNEVGKEEGIGRVRRVLGVDRDEEKVENVGFMEVDGGEEMGGGKRKEGGGMRVVERCGKGRDGNRDRYDVMMVGSGVLYGC